MAVEKLLEVMGVVGKQWVMEEVRMWEEAEKLEPKGVDLKLMEVNVEEVVGLKLEVRKHEGVVEVRKHEGVVVKKVVVK